MEKQNKYDLTEGNILQKLLMVSLPIMGNQFVQMAYNLADMFWLGRVGSAAVAAASTAGMYMWLSMAFTSVGAKGAEIGVSQNMGRGDLEKARHYGETALGLAIILGTVYGAAMLLFPQQLVGFFRLEETHVTADAITYMMLVAPGIPFSFIMGAASGICIGSGNSRIPFLVNAAALALNILLDPILISGVGMGVAGAAVATSVAQILGACLLLWALAKHPARPFPTIRFLGRPRREESLQTIRWSLPIVCENFLFTFFAMYITRLITPWGAGALAAQKVGSQMESLSWLIGGGFSAALAAFAGQNYGGKKWDRIHQGFRMSSLFMGGWGVMVTILLYALARPFVSAFFPNEPSVVSIGVNYIHILAVIQIPACLEGVGSGAFRGIGRTLPPSLISITCNGLRVLLAWRLSQTSLGLEGIWWAIAIGAGARGMGTYLWYCFYKRKLPATEVLLTDEALEH